MANQLFQDFSGVKSPTTGNPFNALIEATSGSADALQQRYLIHRESRNEQQKKKLLSADFEGFLFDNILQRLCDPKLEPGYVDPRHSLVFWSRPTEDVKRLIAIVQRKLQEVAKGLWLMPEDCLHTTTLEITHSKTSEEIAAIIQTFEDKFKGIADYPYEHRTRLIKPAIGFDAAAIAISFVPAAGEALSIDRNAQDDEFTYHHLRRDVFNLCTEAGITVDSRYVVPTAHLTVARFIEPRDFQSLDGSLDRAKVAQLILVIEDLNVWLQREYWPLDSGDIKPGGEFMVGSGKGLVFREGTLWYGGGRSIYEGKGY